MTKHNLILKLDKGYLLGICSCKNVALTETDLNIFFRQCNSDFISMPSSRSLKDNLKYLKLSYLTSSHWSSVTYESSIKEILFDIELESALKE